MQIYNRIFLELKIRYGVATHFKWKYTSVDDIPSKPQLSCFPSHSKTEEIYLILWWILMVRCSLLILCINTSIMVHPHIPVLCRQLSHLLSFHSLLPIIELIQGDFTSNWCDQINGCASPLSLTSLGI